MRQQPERAAVKAVVRRRLAPHQLRHAYAVEMAREGVPQNVIQRQLGNANLETRLSRTDDPRQRRSTPTSIARRVGPMPLVSRAKERSPIRPVEALRCLKKQRLVE